GGVGGVGGSGRRGEGGGSGGVGVQGGGLCGGGLAPLWAGESLRGEAAGRARVGWLAHAPADRVAFWDFDDPKIPDTLRDTSATAIVTASLLTLAPRASTPDRARVPRRCRGHGRRARDASPQARWDADGRLLQPPHRPRHPARARLG